jgi:Domain of unknown function (DUF4258)
MAKPQPLSPDEAKEKILVKLTDGKLELTDHCLYERMPERNVDYQDIISVLETGEIKRKPEWDIEHQNWKYRVEGFDTVNDDLTAVTIILDWVIIVTVF